MNYSDLFFFKPFEQEEIKLITSLMIPATYGAGETILREGEITQLLMLIIDGKVKVLKKIDDNNTKLLAIIEKGEIFGEMSFFDDGVHNATIVAHSDTSLLVISKKDFDMLTEKHPKLMIKFLKRVIQMCSNRIRNLNEEVKQLGYWCITLREGRK